MINVKLNFINMNVYYAHLFYCKVRKIKEAKESKSSYMRHGNKSDSKNKGGRLWFHISHN